MRIQALPLIVCKTQQTMHRYVKSQTRHQCLVACSFSAKLGKSAGEGLRINFPDDLRRGTLLHPALIAIWLVTGNTHPFLLTRKFLHKLIRVNPSLGVNFAVPLSRFNPVSNIRAVRHVHSTALTEYDNRHYSSQGKIWIAPSRFLPL